MLILNFKEFMRKYKLKDDTVSESDLRRAYNYHIHPRDSKIRTNRGFVKIDIGSQGGTHWVCFILKDRKSSYFVSFGGQPVKFLLKHLPQSII